MAPTPNTRSRHPLFALAAAAAIAFALTLALPSALLTADRYRIQLSRLSGDRKTLAGSYTFEVQRPAAR